MSYVVVWLLLFVLIALNRLLGTSTPLVEHAAGLYFAAAALILHRLICWLGLMAPPRESNADRI